MPKITKPLTQTEVKNAKTDDKDLTLFDGNGLQLRVRKSGTKQWNFNYRHPMTKKRVNISLGQFPGISLTDARKLAENARTLVSQGVDPKEERQSKQHTQKQEALSTLKAVAAKWFEIKKDSVTPDYAEDIWRSLELHIFPKHADDPVKEIRTISIIDTLRPLEQKGSLETVKRVCQRLNEVMTYAVNTGLADSNPLAGIRAGFKKPEKKHMNTISPEELPALLHDISEAQIRKVTRLLIKWQLHTMTRPSEAAGTRWDEIDLEKSLWVIPAERMKKRKAHTIPLSKQALNLLETIKTISGHRPYVFPADRDPKTHTNSQTANMALKRMGYANKLVSHGLRSIASTALNEQGFDPELIETALAHVGKDQVRNAYNRAEYIERRREMMQWWSEFIERAAYG